MELPGHLHPGEGKLWFLLSPSRLARMTPGNLQREVSELRVSRSGASRQLYELNQRSAATICCCCSKKAGGNLLTSGQMVQGCGCS